MMDREPAADARLAIRLFARDPAGFGAICLSGDTPVREALIDDLRHELPPDAPILRLPPHADDAALLGGVDLAASLAAGRAVRHEGLLARAGGGIILVPMAERIDAALAGRLAQALDDPKRGFGMVLLDDGRGADEQLPASLRERAALLIDCTLAGEPEGSLQGDEPLADPHATLAQIAATLGVPGLRPLLQAVRTARAHARFEGRSSIGQADVAFAVRTVLLPRATQLPQPEDDAPSDAAPEPPESRDSDASSSTAPSEETILEAALASLPPDVLARLVEGNARHRARGSGGGKRARSAQRGRPLGARAGMPRGGARLALIDTLRAAVPWQPLRRAEPGADPARLLHLRKSDLRVRRFHEKSRAVTILCVDASGSAAMARLAEAKGAVERLLAQAYVTRSEVALVAFRGTTAELLLPPTRSLTRARRALTQLPGGGGTPLATGIALARSLADQAASRGATPLLVFLTDGSANVAADGTGGRAGATADALAAARALAATGHPALVIDIAPRPRPEAETLAGAMQARYLPLPLAGSAAIEQAVRTARPEGLAA